MLWLTGKDVNEAISMVDSLNVQGPRRIAYRTNGSPIRFRPNLSGADVVMHYSCMFFGEDEVLTMREQRVTLVSLPCPHPDNAHL